MTARDIDPDDLTISEMERHPPAIDPPKGKAYERELTRLQIEMLKMQLWAKETDARVLMIFEGRDAAGKGGAIRRFTEHPIRAAPAWRHSRSRPRRNSRSGTSNGT